MATIAQCLYCFETLVANIEERDALSLTKVELLWSEYTAQQEAPDTTEQDDTVDTADTADNTETANHEPTTLAPQPKRGLLSPASSGSPYSSSSSSTPSTRPDSSMSMSSSRSSLSTAQAQSTLASRLRARKTDKYPAFVTWNVMSPRGAKNLRGCIGTFDAQPLDDVLRTYALTSAFEDTRFQPISAAELPTLECSVTLLTDFEPAPGPLDWELGKHGLRISFSSHGKRMGATYLPDVPREQGWNKEETMVSLMRKAGWSGRRDDWMAVPELSVVRYQGSREAVSFAAWRAWREWVGRKGKA